MLISIGHHWKRITDPKPSRADVNEKESEGIQIRFPSQRVGILVGSPLSNACFFIPALGTIGFQKEIPVPLIHLGNEVWWNDA
jgi:hypothetical protein